MEGQFCERRVRSALVLIDVPRFAVVLPIVFTSSHHNVPRFAAVLPIFFSSSVLPVLCLILCTVCCFCPVFFLFHPVCAAAFVLFNAIRAAVFVLFRAVLSFFVLMSDSVCAGFVLFCVVSVVFILSLFRADLAVSVLFVICFIGHVKEINIGELLRQGKLDLLSEICLGH